MLEKLVTRAISFLSFTRAEILKMVFEFFLRAYTEQVWNDKWVENIPVSRRDRTFVPNDRALCRRPDRGGDYRYGHCPIT